jgi:hypothetical protein
MKHYVDWEAFSNMADAVKVAYGLAQPGEQFSIVEVTGPCSICVDLLGKKLAMKAGN